jgi:hypothetical protein
MKKQYFLFSISITFGLFFFDSRVATACTLDTILEMRQQGAGREYIERACPGFRVDDMPRCTRSQVLTYVFGDLCETSC